MDILESIEQRLKQNEETAQKFHEIEISILSILNFQALFESLLTQISNKFNIPIVWLSIIEDNPISEYIKDIADSDILKSKTTFLPLDVFNEITEINDFTPLLVNTNMENFVRLYPAIHSKDIASLAIVPITLDGKMIGSINLGDPSPERFEPGIDTSLLEQLAVKISLCFSNVTAHERLKHLAFHDPLTGLVNRRVMDRILKRECDRSQRYNTSLCVVFFDVDDFKHINDRYGHNKGDQALILIANLIENLKRESDIIARYAGDEFVAILPSTILEQANDFVVRIKNELLKKSITAKNENFLIHLSHGVASFFEDNCKSPAKLLEQADTRLYIAKQRKNTKP